MQLKIQRSQRVGGVLSKTVFFCLDVRADYSPEEASNIRRYKLGSQVIYNSSAAKKHLDALKGLGALPLDTVQQQAANFARGTLSLVLAKMNLNISLASLGKGHHIECKDLDELLETEDTVRNACKNVTRFLDVASTFNGSEVVIEYKNGEELVHIAQNSPPMLIAAPTPPAVSVPREVIAAPEQEVPVVPPNEPPEPEAPELASSMTAPADEPAESVEEPIEQMIEPVETVRITDPVAPLPDFKKLLASTGVPPAVYIGGGLLLFVLLGRSCS